MGLHPAKAVCGEEPHWKLSPVSLQYEAADITDNDNFGAALEATRQVTLVCTNLTPETYNICQFHMGKRQGAWTMSLWHIVGRSHCSRQRTRLNRLCSKACELSCIRLYPGVSVPMTGCCTTVDCCAISIATPCSAQRTSQPKATLWHRSSQPTLGGAAATP
jgi:hypothetical protein